MAFKPIVRAPREMDRRIFRSEPMGLRADLLRLPFDARFNYDDQRNILYLNFEDLEVKSMDLITDTVAKIREICEPLGHKVYAVVNYDHFEFDREFENAYLDAVQDIGERYFHGVTRFTTSAFMRAKPGHALESRGVGPHTSTNPKRKPPARCVTPCRARSDAGSHDPARHTPHEETTCRYPVTPWTP